MNFWKQNKIKRKWSSKITKCNSICLYIAHGTFYTLMHEKWNWFRFSPVYFLWNRYPPNIHWTIFKHVAMYHCFPVICFQRILNRNVSQKYIIHWQLHARGRFYQWIQLFFISVKLYTPVIGISIIIFAYNAFDFICFR